MSIFPAINPAPRPRPTPASIIANVAAAVDAMAWPEEHRYGASVADLVRQYADDANTARPDLLAETTLGVLSRGLHTDDLDSWGAGLSGTDAALLLLAAAR